MLSLDGFEPEDLRASGSCLFAIFVLSRRLDLDHDAAIFCSSRVG
jgi:hypothetical protein